MKNFKNVLCSFLDRLITITREQIFPFVMLLSFLYLFANGILYLVMKAHGV